jgi:rfaE bifunctional protein kinase chain/domain
LSPSRFHELTRRYADLRIAIVGDFCLDRYLEIDPAKKEVSLETGLPVHNVINVRAQPGGAGTVLNNLVSLGVRTIFPIGFCGEDGEGYELRKALAANPGVRLDHFLQTPERRTSTYCKPLVLEPGKPPRELNRLDQKNWSPTPAELSNRFSSGLVSLARELDGIIILRQTDSPLTGVVTADLLAVIPEFQRDNPRISILADSRTGLHDFPPVIFKMNAAELAALERIHSAGDMDAIKAAATRLARQQAQSVFVTLAERGILGADSAGGVEHSPALPLRGQIDIVGAGDAVSANLQVALCAGASLREAIDLANIAASIVIHQIGTTGTASVPQMKQLLFSS